MAGFSSLSDLVSELTVNGKVLECSFFKSGSAPEANGVWHDLWPGGGYPAAGGNGAAGSGTPGSGGTALTLADGSLVKWANTSPDTKHLLTFGAVASQDCTLMLYDRLVSVALGAITSTGSKNVGSAALPRYSGAASIGVEVWAQVTTVTATSAPVMHLLTYTDQDGNTGNVGGNLTFPAAATNVDALVGPFPLAAGDTGVRSVETVNVDTASGGSGAVNIVLLKPLAYLPLVANTWGEREFLSMLPSLPRLFDGHTLGIAMLATGTTATNVWGMLRAAYG